MKKIIIFIAFLLSSGFSQNRVHKAFIGEWHGRGSLMGKEATFEMKWEHVLDGQFLRLTFQNNINGQFSFKGHAYYRTVSDSTMKGSWFDNRGYIFPLNAKFTENTITSNWGTPEIEQGRTEYKIGSDSSFQVTDFVLKKGTYVKFGEAVYQKKE